MNLARILLSIAWCAGMCACSSSDPKALVDEGLKAMNSGQPADAIAKFERALKVLDAEDPVYFEARLGIVIARIEGDPERAVDECMALAAEMPEKVGEKELLYVSGQMISARKFSEALQLVHKGIQRAGGKSPALLVRIETIKKESANNSKLRSELETLGYL